ncbi:DUF2568 domain-containing protein [Mesorhizobium sp. WSM3224]|uniref:DUF2568 domain-containing protein n=1 Tax=Mesorhizobium sp. WSM3224 TaxID=1040986 RepID=UPI0032B0029D
MGNAWWNLTLRFLLELSALLGLGMAGCSFPAGFGRWILAFALPIVAAVLWAPSRCSTIRADRAGRRCRCRAPSG